ncbi:hypothetical protein MUU53_19965 [Rhizobium lemnae]|uniref:Uncharacterized protein n=1 Tax=Rhizobium lemnae TaxID=1214924 RepID=A0ABV8EEV8_9HYPH|nr:hypothetical protein [Rhizobium lemnae]MCJ8510172.1 hypothetical protein [Rhizobium lemnae]
MNTTEDVAKLADIVSGANGGGHAKLEALKAELLARFSGAAPGGPAQFTASAAPLDRYARRRISPYGAKDAAPSTYVGSEGSRPGTSTFAPFFAQLPPELMGAQSRRGGPLLVDVRVEDEVERSEENGLIDAAIDEFELAQRHSASLGVAGALVQTALASFKRLTQGQ